MKRSGQLPDWLKELYYIAPVDNLDSICQRGILSHRRAQKLSHISIASKDIQSIRKDKSVPGGKPLHYYANLYLNPRNPMFYRVIQEQGKDKVCVIGVDPTVALIEGTVITDGNAASEATRFYPSPQGFTELEPILPRIRMKFWTAYSRKREQENKRLQCAEVLVPEKVPPEYLRSVYVATESLRACLLLLPGLNLEIRVRPRFFFGEGSNE